MKTSHAESINILFELCGEEDSLPAKNIRIRMQIAERSIGFLAGPSKGEDGELETLDFLKKVATLLRLYGARIVTTSRSVDHLEGVGVDQMIDRISLPLHKESV